MFRFFWATERAPRFDSAHRSQAWPLNLAIGAMRYSGWLGQRVRGVDEDLGCGGGSEGYLAAAGDADFDGFGDGVAGEDGYGGAGHEAGALDELQELRLLVEHAGDFLRGTNWAISEAHEGAFVELAFGGGDGVAVGIDRGVVEQRVHAFQDAVGDGVFEGVGFVVDDGPVEA